MSFVLLMPAPIISSAPGNYVSVCGQQTSITPGCVCRYSSQQRTVLDIYIPHAPHDPQKDATQPELSSSIAGQGCMHLEAGYPVALFCHGGVWATGRSSLHLHTAQPILTA